MRFNIKEDLEGRKAHQALEILAISGPTAYEVMSLLKNKNYLLAEKITGIKVDPVSAEKIVTKYSRFILRSGS